MTAALNPILLHLGPLTIRWYGLILAAAVTASYLLTRRLSRNRIASDDLANLVFVVVIAGFIGARLYHVLNEPAYYFAHPAEIPAVWNGGLAIHGALLGGAGALWWWARRRGWAVLPLLDLLAPGVALGQAIGRWGNFVNQELFGRPTNVPWAVSIDPANRPVGYATVEHFHPTFLYESIGDLIALGVLLVLGRRWKTRRDGDLVLVYLAVTSAIRASTELLRIDRVPLVAGIRLPLLVAAAIAILSITLLALRHARRHRTNGS